MNMHTLHGHNHKNSRLYHKDCRDCRLEIAAPELLEALKEIRDAYGSTANNQTLMLAVAMKKGINAIRKAENTTN